MDRQVNIYTDNVTIVNNSGWTQSSFSIPSTAPCNAYRYLDDLGDGTVKLTFTNTPR